MAFVRTCVVLVLQFGEPVFYSLSQAGRQRVLTNIKKTRKTGKIVTAALKLNRLQSYDVSNFFFSKLTLR